MRDYIHISSLPLVIVTALCAACTTSGSQQPAAEDAGPAPAAATEPATPDPRPRPYGEPVSPRTVQRFPHLQHHLGQILIGNELVQAVLAGVPPDPGEQPWKESLLEMFYREGETWRRLGPLNGIDLRIQPEGRKRQVFYAIGLDAWSNDKEATVLLILSPRATRGMQTRITWSIRPGQPIIRQRFEDFISPTRATRRLRMDMRLRLAGGQQLPTGESDGQTGLALYRSADFLGIASLSNMDIRQDPGGPVLAPRTDLAGGRPGFNYYIGRQGAAHWPAAVAAIRHCRQKIRTKASLYANQLKCRQDYQPVRVTINAPPAGDQDQPSLRLLYVHGEDHRRYGILPVYTGESLTLLAGYRQGYRLLEPTLRGNVERAAFSMEEDGRSSLSLPAFEAARVEIHHAGDGEEESQAPAVLTLQDLGDPAGRAILTEPGTTASGDPVLSANSLLVRQWPLSLRMPEGQYNISLSRGHRGRFCRFMIRAEAGVQTSHSCQDRLLASDPVQHSLTADLAAKQIELQPEELQNLLGIRFISTTPDNHQDRSAVPVYRIHDKNQGMSMAVYPFSPALEEKWENTESDFRGSRLQRLAAFTREFAPASLVELECPDRGISPEDFRRQIIKTDPDAVQIYGCGSRERQQRLAGIVGILHAKRKNRLLITPASGLGNGYTGSWHFPQMAFAKGESPASENLPHLVKSGRYSLSSGATIAPGKGHTSRVSRSGKRWLLPLHLEFFPDTAPMELLIDDGTRVLHRQLLKSPGQQLDLQVEFKAHTRSRWVRVVLRGHDTSSGGIAKGQLQGSAPPTVVLAATNYIPLREEKQVSTP